jgi:molecular chaperone DnaK
VSAKDKATGKEQSIVIKASSGLSDAEVERMVKDAEAHAEEDKKFHELVSARNQADAAIHSAEKVLREGGDKVPAAEKSSAEALVQTLKQLMKGEDKEEIEAKTSELASLAHNLQQHAGSASSAGDAPSNADAGASSAHDNVVDAEFEEVKDDEKKK